MDDKKRTMIVLDESGNETEYEQTGIDRHGGGDTDPNAWPGAYGQGQRL